ncbi:MAG: hypothetical protein J6K04_13240 [Lachnospiraceae bacterium]|nr:hypothetical protein [Lachnospiraceae bacterium]
MQQKKLFGIMACFLCLSFCACQAPQEVVEATSTPKSVEQESTSTVTPTEAPTIEPTVVSVPTETPEPTETPVPTSTPMPSVPPAIVVEIETEIAERRESILNSKTEVEITGTCYYVSSLQGNDENDGLSPETAWATAKHACEMISEGDTVLFKRGDIWRMDMPRCYTKYVTYSAYGEGAKPAFYGSAENATGAEHWSLMEGTDNIWIYDKPVRDSGTVVYNDGEVVVQKHLMYFNGTEYTEAYTDDVPLDLTKMPNNTFVVLLDLVEHAKNPDNYLNGTNLLIYDDMPGVTGGPLYVRCDEGNPGALYESIEISEGKNFEFGGGCIVDNLCVKYVRGNGMMNDINCAEGSIIQNCEIAFCGSYYIQYRADTLVGEPSGDGMGFHGYGNKCLNNYVHDSQQGAFTVELGWNGDVGEGQRQLGGLTCSGNLFENNAGGIGIISFLQETDETITFSDILLEDNIFSHIGYNYICVLNEITSCIDMWFAGDCQEVKNISFRNNVFNLGTRLISLLNIGDAEIDFEGNTYVQTPYQIVCGVGRTYDTYVVACAKTEEELADKVETLLGDTSATVCCYTCQMKNHELEVAKKYGLMPESVPADLSQNISHEEMIELLDLYVEAIDATKLLEWQTISAKAKGLSDTMTKADAALAIFEAAYLVTDSETLFTQYNSGWNTLEKISKQIGDEWGNFENYMNWDMFENIHDTVNGPEDFSFAIHNTACLFAYGERYSANASYLFDRETELPTNWNETVTWEEAVKAVVRVYSMNYPEMIYEYFVK